MHLRIGSVSGLVAQALVLAGERKNQVGLCEFKAFVVYRDCFWSAMVVE